MIMRRPLPLTVITAVSTLLLIGAVVTRAGDEVNPSPSITSVSISNRTVELNLALNRNFDWQRMKFVSIRTFQNDPPSFPPTRHELTFGHHEAGVFEWFQWDFIELGKFEITGEFTIQASTFGGRNIIGVFNPVTNLLSFDGLDYVPYMQTPNVTVRTSVDMDSWQNIDLSDQVPSEFTWGNPVTIRFNLADARQEFFTVEVGGN
ncbi:MAG: hypothetical protein VCA55_02180 [Verrucomicrobiales bacterium]